MSDALPPRKRYVSELGYPGGTHIRHHVITYGGYRQVVSAGAFFHGTEKKHDMDVKRGIIWNSHHEDEHYLYTRKYMGFSIWADDIEVIEHESIWAFYEYIGYDYKKKKFV